MTYVKRVTLSAALACGAILAFAPEVRSAGADDWIKVGGAASSTAWYCPAKWQGCMFKTYQAGSPYVPGTCVYNPPCDDNGVPAIAGCSQVPPCPAGSYCSTQQGQCLQGVHGPCTADADCSDGLFCNGMERCAPRQAGADARGCAPGQPPCAANLCVEATDVCRSASCAIPDKDHDGVLATECGGTDCDDNDPRRFPGNVEVCDTAHDEDCNPATFGVRDRDGDGFSDSTCCNVAPGGQNKICGTDCDDTSASVGPGSQVCNLDGTVNVCRVFVAANVGQPPFGSRWDKRACPAHTSCVTQPNGTGLCVPGAIR